MLIMMHVLLSCQQSCVSRADCLDVYFFVLGLGYRARVLKLDRWQDVEGIFTLYPSLLPLFQV